ncbi:MAG TPA: rod shape-determining protein [Parachlamydiaceae bacterium]|nr:rod shape-determining protein [Parachlamydiaceae bacterium]
MTNTLMSSPELKDEETVYDRISLGIDIGTSHCQVTAYGKSYDAADEEKYVYTKEPISSSCVNSLIWFAKNNETSIAFLLNFQKNHSLPLQEEHINGVKIPYVFVDQIENLFEKDEITSEEFDLVKRSTSVHYPIKTKKINEPYSDLENAVIRLTITRSLAPFIESQMPLDIVFAKPCEAGAKYDEILKKIASQITNKNKSYDNRFIINSEAVFIGHYLLNMLKKKQGAITICDIGAGTGDIYIFDQDDSLTKAMKSFTLAGNQTTHELMKKLKEHANVDISERDANLLKEKHGFIAGYNTPESIKTVLVDLYLQGKPRKVRCGKSIDAACRPMAHEAIRTIVEVFKQYGGVHPKTLALTGYQGQLEGLDKFIEEGLHLEGYDVTVMNLKHFGENDPRSIVAKGAEGYSHNIKNQNWLIL